MIVPSRRLLLAFLVAAVPLCAAVTLSPQLAVLWLGLTTGTAALLAWDAYRSMGLAKQVSLTTPPLLKLSRGRSGTLGFLFSNPSPKALRLRFSVSFPRGLSSSREPCSLAIPARSESVYPVEVTGTERGRFQVASCPLESVSQFGFWLVRETFPLRLEVQVYPNLAKNAVAAALLSRKHAGLRSQRQVGKGREFEKLREYSAGDAFDEVHWKATARRGKPIVKVFQIERAQELYVLIDTSRHSRRHHTLDHFVEAALILGIAAQRVGDQFGVLTFSDRVHDFVRAKAGTAHYTQCRNAIYAAQPRPVSVDFPELTTFLQTHLRKRALLFVLANLDDPYAAETLTSELSLLSKRHLVVAASLRQPWINLMFEGPRPESLDDVYAAVAGHVFWHKTEELTRTFRSYGAELTLCTPINIYAQLTDKYLRLKQRQVL